MKTDLSWKVGGQQGEGIESTGEIFANALNRLGYFLYGYRHFSSRIKGGHTNNKIRVSTKPLRSVSDDLNILVAFDQESIDVNVPELSKDGIVIADSKFKPVLPEGANGVLISVPFTEIATGLGTSLMKNMVATGASAALLKLETGIFETMIGEIFSKKGDSVVQKNIEAFKKGYETVQAEQPSSVGLFELQKVENKRRLLMIGNDAIAFGALAAGARLMPAYPITPASEIMEYLIKSLPKFGGTVVQTEDEIAAVTMAIGANFAGVRALTASAGPGLSLMMEAIGLSGMTETPLVIVDTQRGGPSTGLPTKQEQSDINALIHGTHGEIPKIVYAPATLEDCFYGTIQAFNLAEQYQVPVIIASDLALSMGKQTAEPFDYKKIQINRGKLVTEDVTEERNTEYFKRYELTNDHVSPRTIPGVKNGIHHVTGVEHNEEGRPSETTQNRQSMMDKRLSKLNALEFEDALYVDAKNNEADVLLMGMGSTIGVIEVAKTRLEEQGIKVNQVHVKLLHPAPVNELKKEMAKAKKIFVIENNATGQLADILALKVGFAEKTERLLKYNGNPFLPHELFTQVKEKI